jgi:hypothetical protein
MDLPNIVFPCPFYGALKDLKVAVASETLDGSFNFGEGTRKVIGVVRYTCCCTVVNA